MTCMYPPPHMVVGRRERPEALGVIASELEPPHMTCMFPPPQ